MHGKGIWIVQPRRRSSVSLLLNVRADFNPCVCLLVFRRFISYIHIHIPCTYAQCWASFHIFNGSFELKSAEIKMKKKNQIKIYAHLCNNNELHVSLGKSSFCAEIRKKRTHTHSLVHIQRCPLILINFNFLFWALPMDFFIEFWPGWFFFHVIWNQIKAKRALECIKKREHHYWIQMQCKNGKTDLVPSK